MRNRQKKNQYRHFPNKGLIDRHVIFFLFFLFCYVKKALFLKSLFADLSHWQFFIQTQPIRPNVIMLLYTLCNFFFLMIIIEKI